MYLSDVWHVTMFLSAAVIPHSTSVLKVCTCITPLPRSVLYVPSTRLQQFLVHSVWLVLYGHAPQQLLSPYDGAVPSNIDMLANISFFILTSLFFHERKTANKTKAVGG